jgi:maltose phosphorylase
MATKRLARNLLTYRYNQLDKAIENAQNNLGFKTDCPLSNGYHEWEECHNEWEITHEDP